MGGESCEANSGGMFRFGSPKDWGKGKVYIPKQGELRLSAFGLAITYLPVTRHGDLDDASPGIPRRGFYPRG